MAQKSAARDRFPGNALLALAKRFDSLAKLCRRRYQLLMPAPHKVNFDPKQLGYYFMQVKGLWVCFRSPKEPETYRTEMCQYYQDIQVVFRKTSSRPNKNKAHALSRKAAKNALIGLKKP